MSIIEMINERLSMSRQMAENSKMVMFVSPCDSVADDVIERFITVVGQHINKEHGWRMKSIDNTRWDTFVRCNGSGGVVFATVENEDIIKDLFSENGVIVETVLHPGLLPRR